ncbi:MAG TPA: hypothetical protein VFA14_02720, partial [Herbaspirillum sp.]|nr:hypothetical protein [Herbaspirillum sp.]
LLRVEAGRALVAPNKMAQGLATYKAATPWRTRAERGVRAGHGQIACSSPSGKWRTRSPVRYLRTPAWPANGLCTKRPAINSDQFM